MKFLNKEYQWSKIQSTPHSPKTEINAASRLFSLTVFYRGLRHEHVTDFTDVVGCWVHELLISFWTRYKTLPLVY